MSGPARHSRPDICRSRQACAEIEQALLARVLQH
jgi:hypothetical protein